MIHCTMEDLIAVRDGEGSGWARRHVETCGECRHELDALHQRVAALRALPALTPPRDRWPVVRDALLAARRARRWKRTGWVSLAAAASLALTVGGGTLWKEQTRVRAKTDLATLVQRSRELEDLLHFYGPEYRVMTGAQASAVAALEDRVALIDARLGQGDPESSRDEMMDLWRQRVQTMNALVQVHAVSGER